MNNVIEVIDSKNGIALVREDGETILFQLEDWKKHHPSYYIYNYPLTKEEVDRICGVGNNV